MARLLLLAVVLALAMPPGPAGATSLTGRASVIDGDTLEIRGVRIRLHAIDAPESAQTCRRWYGRTWRCGAAAANALAERIGQAPVQCVGRGTDRWRRLVAVCSQGGRDLGRWMVASGWAVAETRYGRAYVADEAAARRAGRGIWSGRFERPSEWRRAQRGG